MTLKKGTNGGVTNTIHPLAKGRACASCKARKVRCDAGTPSCSSCRRTARFEHRDPALVVCTYGGNSCGVKASGSKGGKGKGVATSTIKRSRTTSPSSESIKAESETDRLARLKLRALSQLSTEFSESNNSWINATASTSSHSDSISSYPSRSSMDAPYSSLQLPFIQDPLAQLASNYLFPSYPAPIPASSSESYYLTAPEMFPMASTSSFISNNSFYDFPHTQWIYPNISQQLAPAQWMHPPYLGDTSSLYPPSDSYDSSDAGSSSSPCTPPPNFHLDGTPLATLQSDSKNNGAFQQTTDEYELEKALALPLFPLPSLAPQQQIQNQIYYPTYTPDLSGINAPNLISEDGYFGFEGFAASTGLESGKMSAFLGVGMGRAEGGAGLWTPGWTQPWTN